MALDPYQPCPCGSGKKIKFCCSDLIGEMEKVYRMLEGDQPRAALRHIEQTLAKYPGRASLLDLQASLQHSLNMLDEAKATVTELVRCDPKSPIAHAQYALVASVNGDPAEAIEALQTALELTEDTIAQRVFEAIGAVGMACLQANNVVAAQAHLWLHQRIAPPDDRQAIAALYQLNSQTDMPLLLRDQLLLKVLPDSHPVGKEMAEIALLAMQGKWRQAATKCDELLPDHLDEPLFFYNRALLSGFLGDEKNLIAGLRLYARQSIPYIDAVEAEAIAQYLDDEARELPVQLVKLEYPVTGADGELLERLLGSEYLERYELAPEDVAVFEGPRPRGSFCLYDRPIPQSLPTEEWTREKFPRELGLLLYFGRQTDRPERIELSLNPSNLDKGCETLQKVAGDLLGEETARTELDSQLPGGSIVVPDWWVPVGSTKDQRRQWFAEERREALLERWPDRSLRALQGKTPREAATIEELQLPLAAYVYLLEETQRDEPTEMFRELRQNLGLSELEPTNLDGTAQSGISLARAQRADLAQIEDRSLQSLYSRAILAFAPRVLYALAKEALTRESTVESMGKGGLYRSMFRCAPSIPAAMEVLDQAREWEKTQGTSDSQWDLLELQLHIVEGNTAEADRVMRHVQSEHLEEPEVALQVFELLQSLGVLDGSPHGHAAHDHQAHAHGAHPAPAAQVAEGGIWTPGSETAAAKGGSKIWTPD